MPDKQARDLAARHALMRLLFSLGILVLGYQTASASDDRDTLRCGSSIIEIGSTAGEVLYKCGEPASGSQRETITVDGKSRHRTIITNAVEDWIFNFGPHQFQYMITLKNGRVKRIQSLGKGY